ncbi:MAG: MBOAT family protein [Candidatus Omnitrophica bacterium]|nr:MBOAT family protein [Candidatus Omnitrophota bacterium]
MLFNSTQFIAFFVIVYICYLLVSHQWQNRLLIIASCIFYASWNWKFLFLMFVSISTDFFCSQHIYRSEDRAVRRNFLVLSVAVNLAILGFFKYCNFFLGNLNALLEVFGLEGAFQTLSIILPLGISFYTFEAISYTVDVYRGVSVPAKKYGDYLFFVIYFPHLIAGPIMRAKDFLPQVTTPRVVTRDLFFEGLFLAFWGFFEKMFIADNLAKVVNPVFAGPTYDGAMVLLAVYAFAFQIFCDFDGYSNIARGLGKCMGFNISINFNLPYFATNPTEFWKRWHMTLSSWLRDYLYIPLGGNRRSTLITFRNLMITMLLGGLWHGASWTFVIWGAYHGLLLSIHKAVKDFCPGIKLFERAGWREVWFLVRLGVFFHLTCLGWLFFRARSFDQVRAMLEAVLFHFHGNGLYPWAYVLLILAPLLIVQVAQYRTGNLLFLYRQHWVVRTFAYSLMAYLILGWGIMRAEEFIYFQF